MADSTLKDLEQRGVRTVRVTYPDLHGISRGKDYPISHFPHVIADGGAYCEAIMTVDLRHNVVAGPEHGFQDILARPDLDTLVPVPWEQDTAWCLADLVRMDGSPYGVDPRATVRRAVAAYAELGLTPIVGPELEFYLCAPDPAETVGYRRYVDNPSHVYTVGQVADPRGLLTAMLHACVDMGLGAIAANHEYGRSQFEINLTHGPALQAADRAFRFKSVVKDMAAREGLLATFIGKPWNDDEGSGFHLHLSLNDGDGKNALNGPGDDGLSPLCPAHDRRAARARAGADGVLQPHHQRVPPPAPGGARADARELGPRQPADAGARSPRAGRRDQDRVPGRRRRGEPVPRNRSGAVCGP